MATAKRMFEFVSGNSSKFWEVWIDGVEVCTRYGRIGSAGRSTRKAESNIDKAKELYEKLITEKSRNGYTEMGKSPASHVKKALTKKRAPAARKGPAVDIGALIQKVEAKAEAVGVKLPRGAKKTDIAKAEKAMGVRLPDEVCAFYLCHDGGGDTYFVENRELLSLRRMVGEWKIWKELFDKGEFDEENAHGTKGVQTVWWIPEWIPVTYDGAGNHDIIDIAPGKGGTHGQIVSFYHDDESRRIEAKSFLVWLANKATFNNENEN